MPLRGQRASQSRQSRKAALAKALHLFTVLPMSVASVRVETVGNATLYLADCSEVLPLGSPVDLLLTDPPYGIGEAAKNHKSRNRMQGGKPIISPDYGQDEWDDAPPEAHQIASCVASAGNAIIWGGNYFGLPAASKWLVWDKENSGDFADCELAWTNLPGAVRIFRHMWNGMLRASERNAPRVHPTQKPILLMEWCISQAGEVSHRS